jgi:ABC-2 type transport system ATP-binding protein
VLDQPIETLSKGFRRRVGLAQAILHDPDVLVLDEPTDGLDPNQKHAVRDLIRGMAKDKTIIISTHLLEEVEAICTRAVIIDQGRIVADATPAALAARSPSGRLDDVFRQLTTRDTATAGASA